LTEYFKLQGVPAEKQVGCFIALIGCKYCNLLKNLIYPLTYNDKSFQEIVHILKKHLNPAPPLILSRHIFINRKQQAEETVSEYITHLRKLVIPCRYEGEMLNSMLRDVLVSGLISKPILDILFEEEDIDLNKTISILLLQWKVLHLSQNVYLIKLHSPSNLKLL